MRASLILRAYGAGAVLARPFAPLLVQYRLKRGKEDPDRTQERFGIANRERPAGPLVWFHAASVGETNSIVALIEQIQMHYGVNCLLTTGTVTSMRVAKARLPETVIHQFIPLDGHGFVKRFLDHWCPDMAIFAESELWPNMLRAASARSIPLVLVNARMSERSHRRWRRLPGAIRAVLGLFDLCLAQSDLDAERLDALGAGAVIRTGNLKFDVPPPRADEHELHALRLALSGRHVWCAVSTHGGEEELVLEALRILLPHVPGLCVFIAPRHPERGEAVAALAQGAGMRVSRRSLTGVPADDDAVFVMDTIGELGLVLRSAPVALMGGSLVRHGGQNPIEPAKLGAAILHGPHVSNFSQVYAALDAAGGAERVSNATELAQTVINLLASPQSAERRTEAALTAIAPFGGALNRTMAALEPLMRLAASPR